MDDVLNNHGYRDLVLDIGGLNLENAHLFLERHGIPVTSSETGGCNTMSLVFNSQDSSAFIQQTIPACIYSEKIFSERKAPTEKEINDAIKSFVETHEISS